MKTISPMRLCLLALTVAVGILLSPPYSGSPALADVHQVEIKGFVFEPAVIRVKAGDMIVWENRDIVPHTATAVDGNWDSGDLPEGAAGKVTFIEAGTYSYSCLYHPGMQGTVIVQP